MLYDEYADRWIASQFSLPNYPAGPFYELIAVSDDGDPNGTWYRYAYEFANMPDYPKFGVWHDGYYMTINQFKPRSGSYAGGGVVVFNRTQMLAGNPDASMIMFNLGTAYGSLLPADADGSAASTGGNFFANLGTNSLRIWQSNINWSSPSSSTLSLTQTLTTNSFSYSGITINQPGTSQTLDPLASRLMYRLQYRKFSGYEVMLTNHTVNANGAGQAGVRWYELRKNTGGSWAIYQQGTYAPNDGIDRWMASVAMNGFGDIAVGYSGSSSSSFPSVRFAGQTAASSGTGILDVAESIIHAGTASQTGVNRWGDYSMMSVDPTNDATFWYTNEYSSGGWNWRTKIASFNFPTTSPPPVPVVAFTGAPTTINAGQSVTFTDNSTNNPTSWSWQFPGGTPATSTAQNPVVVYNTTGVYSVTLTASNSTGSGTPLTKTNYITVNTPPAGNPPIASFTATPTIVTVGGTVQFTDLSSNTPTTWSWSFPGGTPSTSTLQNPTIQYNTAGAYSVTLTASNANGTSQPYTRADYITVNPPAGYCTSTSTSNATDWITKVVVGAYTNTTGAALYTNFASGPTLTPGLSTSVNLTPNSTSRKNFWRVWIDYNADNDFDDAGELVFSANNRKGIASGSFIVPSGVSGTARMRVTMKNGGAPTSCETFTNGEVEDYLVTFGGAAAPIASENADNAFDLQLYPNPAADILNVVVKGEADKVNMKVYNAFGVIIQDFDTREKTTVLNLSNYAKGIYYVGADNGITTTLKKFIKE